MQDDNTEIDPISGQLRTVQLHQNSMVYQPFNHNLFYTKNEIDAIVVTLKALIAAGGGGSTSNVYDTGVYDTAVYA